MRIATCWGRPCPVKIWDVRIHSCHLDSTFNEPQKISCREGTQRTLGHCWFPLSCGMRAPNALICCWGKATLHTPAWGENSITRSLPRWLWAYVLIITFWAVMPSDSAMLLDVSPVTGNGGVISQLWPQDAHAYTSLSGQTTSFFYSFVWEDRDIENHSKQTGKCTNGIGLPPP